MLLKIDSDKRKDLAERKRLINESDVTFLCLPDDAAKESVSLVDNPNTCVIDASTAHRVNPAWTFGLPELAKDQRAKIKASKRIANPGCHASAFILALRPLVEAGLLPAATQIAANSITGYSGRRQVDDRRLPKGQRKPDPTKGAAPLLARPGPQASAGDAGLHRPDRRADLPAHRRPVLQGPGRHRLYSPAAIHPPGHAGRGAEDHR